MIDNDKTARPHCLACGSTNLSFKYREFKNGGTINEYQVLSMARMFIADAAADVNTSAEAVSEMAYTLYEVAYMMAVREEAEDDADAEKPAHDPQPAA